MEMTWLDQGGGKGAKFHRITPKKLKIVQKQKLADAHYYSNLTHQFKVFIHKGLSRRHLGYV